MHCFVSAPHLPVKEPTVAANEWQRFPCSSSKVLHILLNWKYSNTSVSLWNPTAHCVGSTFTCTEKLNGVPINPKTAGKVLGTFQTKLPRSWKFDSCEPERPLTRLWKTVRDENAVKQQHSKHLPCFTLEKVIICCLATPASTCSAPEQVEDFLQLHQTSKRSHRGLQSYRSRGRRRFFCWFVVRQTHRVFSGGPGGSWEFTCYIFLQVATRGVA